MAVTVYSSTDGSAPVLSGTVGSLVALLDAVLVNGYGSKAAAGWTKPYSGTNGAVYRQAGGNQFYLRVDDNAPNVTSVAREAQVSGYEAMTAFSTGTGQFPTTTQSSTGLVIRKSTTADSTARAWIIIADDRTFYLFIITGDAAGYYAFAFGDFYSYKTTTDSYRTIIIGRTQVNNGTNTYEVLAGSYKLDTNLNSHYIARTFAGTGTSVSAGKHTDHIKCIAALADQVLPVGLSTQTLFNNPNTPDGGFYVAPLWVHEAPSMRGHLRGLWAGCHTYSTVADGDTFSGSGVYAGKTFRVIKPVYANGNTGYLIVETSNTWDTNT
jgi:hypothetical protein